MSMSNKQNRSNSAQETNGNMDSCYIHSKCAEIVSELQQNLDAILR